MKLKTVTTAVGLRRLSAVPVFLMILALAVALGISSPHALSFQNIVNILNQQVSLILVTIGQTLVILTGGLDLSVGSVVSMTTAIVSHDLPYAVPLAVAAALTVGLVNAIGILRLGVHPILMTLSTMTAVQGIALFIRPIPGGQVPDWMSRYSATAIGGVPVAVLAAAVLVILSGILVARSRFGLHLMATGASEDSALLGGVNTRMVILWAYLLSSLFACLGGLNLAARLASGDPLVGAAFSIDSIAATALGGTQLSGGLGGIAGPVTGVLFLALLGNGLNLLNISTYYQMIIKGALLILAVSAHRRNQPGL
ncbi:ABC transporter permease [Aureimonas frigidaquae]|uniref:ABC transporter permease n=1 Tax=Aureimonas frigidaquae TaxID=424757 RepID=UPI000784930E|nr:ABC transporter permease [Aureimonas frigidaquae]